MASSAAFACSALPLTPLGYSLRTTQTSCCAQPQGLNSRPESKRELGDTRSVSLRNARSMTSLCTSRAKDSRKGLEQSENSEVCHEAASVKADTANGNAAAGRGLDVDALMSPASPLLSGSWAFMRCKERGSAEPGTLGPSLTIARPNWPSRARANRRPQTSGLPPQQRASSGWNPERRASAIPVFVAGVSAEHDGGPATPALGRGRRSHTEAA
jgi:hypothetical protein